MSVVEQFFQKIGIYHVRDRRFRAVANEGVWQVVAACKPGATLG